MRKLVLRMSMSLDGFISGPDGEKDWLFQHGSSAAKSWIIEHLGQAGALLMGSRTYRDMAEYWPASDSPFAPVMNEVPKIVFSKSLSVERTGASVEQTPQTDAERSWKEARVITGDLTAEISSLKSHAGKDLYVLGGATFAHGLIAAGLVDEFKLIVAPVAIGAGIPLFSKADRPLSLQLIEAIKLDGPVGLVYTAPPQAA